MSETPRDRILARLRHAPRPELPHAASGPHASNPAWRRCGPKSTWFPPKPGSTA